MKDKFLYAYLKRKWKMLSLSALFSILSACFSLVPFLCVYQIVEELLMGTNNYATMSNWALVALVSFLLSLLLLGISAIISHIAAFNILYEMRIDIINHLSRLSMGYHTEHSSGTIIKIVEQSVEKVENFIAHQIPDISAAVVFPIIYIGIMLTIDIRFAAVSIIPIFLSVAMMAKMNQGIQKEGYVMMYHDALEDMNSNGVEYIRAMPAVKVFGLRVISFKKFSASIQNYRNFVFEWSKSFKKGFVLFNNILLSMLFFIIPLGAYLLTKNPQSLALSLTVIFFFILTPGLSAPIVKLMYTVSAINNIMEGLHRVDDIMNEEPLKEVAHSGHIEHHDIDFQNVSFSYTEGIDVLKQINLHIPEHQITALVGPSGGGKSTLASLLLRFYDINQGSIKIGGVDIRELTTDDLMKYVSFVFQDVYLFQDTIEENIRMGNNTIGKDEVLRVAKIARCHDFIQNLPQAYNTFIGEKGVQLSKGEAQRISIARALLKDAPILVLDEATAYADAENELLIQQAIGELIKEKTVIIIAHRLWTIQNADQIIVIEEGKVIEEGTHENLLKEKGRYYDLWEINDRSSKWEIKGGSNYV